MEIKKSLINRINKLLNSLTFQDFLDNITADDWYEWAMEDYEEYDLIIQPSRKKY